MRFNYGLVLVIGAFLAGMAFERLVLSDARSRGLAQGNHRTAGQLSNATSGPDLSARGANGGADTGEEAAGLSRRFEKLLALESRDLGELQEMRNLSERWAQLHPEQAIQLLERVGDIHTRHRMIWGAFEALGRTDFVKARSLFDLLESMSLKREAVGAIVAGRERGGDVKETLAWVEILPGRLRTEGIRADR